MTYDLPAAARVALNRSTLSQRELADRADVHFTTINRWVKGRRDPDLTELNRTLALVGCGVRIIDLATGDVIEPGDDKP